MKLISIDVHAKRTKRLISAAKKMTTSELIHRIEFEARILTNLAKSGKALDFSRRLTAQWETCRLVREELKRRERWMDADTCTRYVEALNAYRAARRLLW